MKYFFLFLFILFFLFSCSSTKKIQKLRRRVSPTIEETRRNMEKNIREMEMEINSK